MLIGREYAVVLLQALTRRRMAGMDLVVSDAASIALLRQGLRSPHAGAVVYSARMLEEAALAPLLPELLAHPAPEVRRDTLERIARLRPAGALAAIKQRVLLEELPAVKARRCAPWRRWAILMQRRPCSRIWMIPSRRFGPARSLACWPVASPQARWLPAGSCLT